jgi:hypothetical protein
MSKTRGHVQSWIDFVATVEVRGPIAITFAVLQAVALHITTDRAAVSLLPRIAIACAAGRLVAREAPRDAAIATRLALAATAAAALRLLGRLLLGWFLGRLISRLLLGRRWSIGRPLRAHIGHRSADQHQHRQQPRPDPHRPTVSRSVARADGAPTARVG